MNGLESDGASASQALCRTTPRLVFNRRSGTLGRIGRGKVGPCAGPQLRGFGRNLDPPSRGTGNPAANLFSGMKERHRHNIPGRGDGEAMDKFRLGRPEGPRWMQPWQLPW